MARGVRPRIVKHHFDQAVWANVVESHLVVKMPRLYYARIYPREIDLAEMLELWVICRSICIILPRSSTIWRRDVTVTPSIIARPSNHDVLLCGFAFEELSVPICRSCQTLFQCEQRPPVQHSSRFRRAEVLILDLVCSLVTNLRFKIRAKHPVKVFTSSSTVT